jgi:diaminohydroxyphosphoribosylaminopyrimidine deaminase/5-amino-6-(5-phosphoribosylamino)uracil reductase
VSGQGIKRLRDAGVDVTLVEEISVRDSLRPYLHQRRTGRPFVVLKAATSIDGRLAAADFTSQWLTGPSARAGAHEIRADSQAVIVGAGTALADRPSLNAREVREPVKHQPMRVLLDGRGRVPAEGPLFDQKIAPTVVFTTAQASAEIIAAWSHAGAEVEVVGPGDGAGVDLSAALSSLARRGVIQAMVEGGAGVFGSLFRANLVDRLTVCIAGVLLGQDGVPLVQGPWAQTLSEAPRWTLGRAQVLDGDVWLEYDPPERP